MKRILLFVFVFAGIYNAKAQKPYQIKSCKIEFSFNNGMQAGSKTLIIADSGAYEKEEGIANTDTAALKKSDLPVEFKSMNSQLHIIIIHTPDSVFSANVNLNIATKRAALYMMGSNPLSPQLKVVGHDTFLGKPCEIKDLEGFKLWFWKGICLKKEMNVDGIKIYEYVTSIDENYVIKQDEFVLPKGLTLKE